MVCGTSWFPVSELSQRLKQKSVKNPLTKVNEYQREYQQICKQTPRFTIGDCAGGHRADNREKNRDVLIVPRKFCVVYISSESLLDKKKLIQPLGDHRNVIKLIRKVIRGIFIKIFGYDIY